MQFFSKILGRPNGSSLSGSESQTSVSQPKGLLPIYTFVPDGEPIELVDYYPDFLNYYPECELQTKRWFVENVEKDWVIFDVGANIGYYSILFSRLAPDGKVFAFEPTETIGKFRSNINHHGRHNISVHQTALGARAGNVEENIFRVWGQPPERRVYTFSTVDAMVETLKLDRLDCIKIDVDSFDYEVLQGAEKTLERFDPWIVIELNHALAKRNQSVSEALEWLIARGYTSAFITDYENYVLRRRTQLASTGSSRIELALDTRPLFLLEARTKGKERPDVLASEPEWHNEAEIAEAQGVMDITVPGSRWNYAASWQISASDTGAPFILEFDVEVRGGEVGFIFVARDFSTQVGKEVFLKPDGVRQTISLSKPPDHEAGFLVLRNTDPFGKTGNVRITATRSYESIPRAPEKPARCLQSTVHSLDQGELLNLVEEGHNETDKTAAAIDIVPVEDLGLALGFARPFVPNKVYRHALRDFNTERDETAIFDYIYRNLGPRRHLEIGTWEGHGATTVARACDAEIWTINLPDGERDVAGNALYGGAGAGGAETASQGSGAPSDAGSAIGWRYRDAGFGNRVHQILCDSRDLDTRQWDAGFFDTIFIDGGHTEEVVCSDTDKTYPLLRSGGLMIWHDFCPEPEALAANEAPRGVVKAMAVNLPRWTQGFQRIFWVRPSWILVGIKGNPLR